MNLAPRRALTSATEAAPVRLIESSITVARSVSFA